MLGDGVVILCVGRMLGRRGGLVAPLFILLTSFYFAVNIDDRERREN